MVLGAKNTRSHTLASCFKTGNMSLTRLTFDFQDRLSFIGPEEFIQTFAMKDPLENHKVALRPPWSADHGERPLHLLMG